MMNLWKIYRPVWQFLLVFFATYGLFSSLYFYALDYWAYSGMIGDPITNFVGRQLQDLLGLLGFETKVAPWNETGNLVISVMGTPVAQLVEGCNAVSVIILFVAFVFAIAHNISDTLLFALFRGSASLRNQYFTYRLYLCWDLLVARVVFSPA